MIIGYLFILLLPLIFVRMIIGTVLGAMLYIAKYRFVAFIVISIVSIPVLKVITAAEKNPAATKIVVGLAGLALAGVAAWYLMPAGNIFRIADDAVAMDISCSGMGEAYEKDVVPYEGQEFIQQAVDSIDDMIYKPVRMGIKGLTGKELTYHLKLKDENGNNIGCISVTGDKYVIITDKNGKAKLYTPYFYNKDDNRIKVGRVIEQLYIKPIVENIDDVWKDFVSAIGRSFSYDDEKITFTMPAEPEGEYKEFSININLVVPYNGRRGFIEVLNIRDVEKVPAGQVYQFDMPKEKLMFIKISLSLDNLAKPLEIKNIPAKYKYSAK